LLHGGAGGAGWSVAKGPRPGAGPALAVVSRLRLRLLLRAPTGRRLLCF
jgi:hypothetical protein